MSHKLAVIFPGQGSQHQGMVTQLIAQDPKLLTYFAQASEILGYDLWNVIVNNPDDKLNQTQYTQPAILVASIVLWQWWHQIENPQPHYLAGHSLGEYSALVCAKSIAFEDAVALVAARGQFMQEAVTVGRGAMAVCVGLSSNQVDQLCKEAAQGEVLAPANYNSPQQTVVAGDAPAVQRFINLAQDAKAVLVKLLPVSVPSHCILMKKAADRLADLLGRIKINTPQVPVIHNVDVKMHSHPDDIRQALVSQLHQPVQWVATINRLIEEKIEIGMECGPGNVLSGLNKRMAPQIITKPVHSLLSNEKEA